MSGAFAFRREQVPPLPVTRGVWHRLRQRRSAQLGMSLAALLTLAMTIGPLFLRFSPEQTNPAQKLQPPSQLHWLGTDQFGRDQMARLLDGGRRSLGAALLVFI